MFMYPLWLMQGFKQFYPLPKMCTSMLLHKYTVCCCIASIPPTEVQYAVVVPVYPPRKRPKEEDMLIFPLKLPASETERYISALSPGIPYASQKEAFFRIRAKTLSCRHTKGERVLPFSMSTGLVDDRLLSNRDIYRWNRGLCPQWALVAYLLF